MQPTGAGRPWQMETSKARGGGSVPMDGTVLRSVLLRCEWRTIPAAVLLPRPAAAARSSPILPGCTPASGSQIRTAPAIPALPARSDFLSIAKTVGEAAEPAGSFPVASNNLPHALIGGSSRRRQQTRGLSPRFARKSRLFRARKCANLPFSPQSQRVTKKTLNLQNDQKARVCQEVGFQCVSVTLW